MADVLHRVNKTYLQSVNTPDYPSVDWIVDPDLSAVAGFEPKYWTIVGDVVSLMTPVEHAAVDAAEIELIKDGHADEYSALHPNKHRAALEIIIDEFNRNTLKFNALLDAIDAANNLGDIKTAAALIQDRPTRTFSDFSTALRNALNG